MSPDFRDSFATSKTIIFINGDYLRNKFKNSIQYSTHYAYAVAYSLLLQLDWNLRNKNTLITGKTTRRTTKKWSGNRTPEVVHFEGSDKGNRKQSLLHCKSWKIKGSKTWLYCWGASVNDEPVTLNDLIFHLNCNPKTRGTLPSKLLSMAKSKCNKLC